ncbi:unnamed protein product [Arabis nemorensis]|uniref:Uncharacterized protein n=1 Tax=Arabis nemorensis TaxID=586526 RepID=A0A565ANB5_9BRAS|nr:unnamed protein product [Arabis nemorensis]
MPKDVSIDPTLHGLHVITSYNGRLAWLYYSGFRVWALKDPEKQEWSDGCYSFPDPSSVPRMDGPYQDRYLELGEENYKMGRLRRIKGRVQY